MDDSKNGMNNANVEVRTHGDKTKILWDGDVPVKIADIVSLVQKHFPDNWENAELTSYESSVATQVVCVEPKA